MKVTLEIKHLRLHLVGECKTALTGQILIDQVQAFDEHGVDVWPRLTIEQKQAARDALWSAHLFDRLPLGEGKDAAV